LNGPKVLWISPTIGSNFGGPTTTVVNGLIAEKRAGLESSLISTHSDADPAQTAPASARLAAGDVTFRLFPRTRLLPKAEAWGFSPRMVLWMIRNLRRYDVVHLQYVWCLSSICGAVISRLHGVPVVVTPHESLTDYDIDVASRSRLKRRVKLVLRRFYLRMVDRLVFMSELEQRDTRHGSVPGALIRHAVQEKPLPVEPPATSPADESLHIAFLGRAIPKKGIDLIIETLGRNRGRNWRLSIAGPPGTGEFTDEMARLAEKLGVAGNVTWLGYMERIEDLFRQCDVLVMPSAYEGFGMVTAEAMGHGLPVIVPRRSGVAEIVDHFGAGIVMPESSVDSLDRALKVMDEGPAVRRSFAERGIRAANATLTYEAFASSTFGLYASLLVARDRCRLREQQHGQQEPCRDVEVPLEDVIGDETGYHVDQQ